MRTTIAEAAATTRKMVTAGQREKDALTLGFSLQTTEEDDFNASAKWTRLVATSSAGTKDGTSKFVHKLKG